jgi:tetratricopeptide (TPR) repeat protein
MYVAWDASHGEFKITDYYYFSKLKKYAEREGIFIEEVNSFWKLGDYETSLAAFIKAHELEPKKAVYVWGMAKCQEKLGSLDDALVLFEKVLKMDIPDSKRLEAQERIKQLKDVIATRERIRKEREAKIKKRNSREISIIKHKPVKGQKSKNVAVAQTSSKKSRIVLLQDNNFKKKARALIKNRVINENVFKVLTDENITPLNSNWPDADSNIYITENVSDIEAALLTR